MSSDRLFAPIYSTEYLRKMIIENPDLPLIVLAGESASDGDHVWTTCSCVRIEKGEILDCEGPNDEYIYTDREELQDDIDDYLYDEVGEIPKDEYEKLLNERIKKYDDHWKKCIIVYVDN